MDANIRAGLSAIFNNTSIALKPIQKRAIEELVNGRDVFVDMSTGGGKTLIFQLLPFVIFNKVFVIISPLIALMREQVLKFNVANGKAGQLAICVSDLSKVEHDDLLSKPLVDIATFFFFTPEKILSDEWRQCLQQNASSISCFIVDEAHCVCNWGSMNASETDRLNHSTAFRPEYSQLYVLRTAVPQANLLALTATAPPHVRKVIRKQLAMREPVVLQAPFKRDNVYLKVKQINKDLLTNFFADEDVTLIFEDIISNKTQAARRVIFVRPSLDTISTVYDTFQVGLLKLTEKEFSDIVGVFHSGLDDQTKNAILEDLADPLGKKRLIISSSALSLGVNMRQVSQILFFGSPPTIADYIQEAGRAGRLEAGEDVMEASCILFFHSFRNVDEEMKKFLTSTNVCRRLILCQYLQPDVLFSSNLKKCCDICTASIK